MKANHCIYKEYAGKFWLPSVRYCLASRLVTPEGTASTEPWTLTLFLDNPYTIEQLSSPSINLSIVQPLVDKFYDPHDVSTGTNNIRLTYSSMAGLMICLWGSLFSASQSSAISPRAVKPRSSPKCQCYSSFALRAGGEQGLATP
jgi:hypothetical protein